MQYSKTSFLLSYGPVTVQTPELNSTEHDI